MYRGGGVWGAGGVTSLGNPKLYHFLVASLDSNVTPLLIKNENNHLEIHTHSKGAVKNYLADFFR